MAPTTPVATPAKAEIWLIASPAWITAPPTVLISVPIVASERPANWDRPDTRLFAAAIHPLPSVATLPAVAGVPAVHAPEDEPESRGRMASGLCTRAAWDCPAVLLEAASIVPRSLSIPERTPLMTVWY